MGPHKYGYGTHHHQPYSNRTYRGYGYSRGGWAYAAPYYYIPLGDYGYDYDYVGGPDLYSGPPMGPNDPTLHIIVEQPPAQVVSAASGGRCRPTVRTTAAGAPGATPHRAGC